MIIFYGYVKLRKQNPKLKENSFGIKNHYLAQGLGWLVFIIVAVATFAQIFEVNIGTTITITPTEGMFGWVGIFVTIIGLIIVIIVGEVLINKGIKAQKNESGNLNTNKEKPKINKNEINKENNLSRVDINIKQKYRINNSIKSKEREWIQWVVN